jgi:hypothetical protein
MKSFEILRLFTSSLDYQAQNQCDLEATIIKMLPLIVFSSVDGTVGILVYNGVGLALQSIRSFSDNFHADFNSSNTKDFATYRPNINSKICGAQGSQRQGGEPSHEQYVIDVAKLNE